MLLLLLVGGDVVDVLVYTDARGIHANANGVAGIVLVARRYHAVGHVIVIAVSVINMVVVVAVTSLY